MMMPEIILGIDLGTTFSKDKKGCFELMLRASLGVSLEVNGKSVNDLDVFIRDGDVCAFTNQNLEVTFLKQTDVSQALQAPVRAGCMLRGRASDGREFSLSCNRRTGRYDMREGGALLVSSVSLRDCLHRGETHGVRWLKTLSKGTNTIEKQARRSAVRAA